MMFLAETAGPHVSIVAEKIFQWGPITVTNSALLGFIGYALTFWLLFYTVRRVQTRRLNRLSVAVLAVYEYLFNTLVEVLGERSLAIKLAPIAIGMFFFICINNWLELLPFVGPLTWHGQPFFRGLAADLNFTAALAVITMVTAQIWAVKHLGFFGNLGRYFRNPFKSPVAAFEGFLELVAEFSRLIALALRLFGNIFGGEVLLAVMGFITVYFSPATLPPFMLLEIFIGLVQAYVFFMLTAVFVSLGLQHGHAPASETDTFDEKDEVAPLPQPAEG
jgi:F-type H+-transporting ATPase subunit a